MSESSTSSPLTPESLVFAANHQPTLKSGNYNIKVEHKFQTEGNDKIPLQTFTTTRSFQVEGERFSLKPEDIQAVFPPKGSLGDHSNVLPHIVLTHSTLPWEHSPDNGNRALTWLALLVFSEVEKPETQVITLGELSNQGAKFPAISLNSHQKNSDPVSVIDVSRQVLEPLLPKLDDLAMLAHVRRLHFSADDTNRMSRKDLHDSERAVIIASRLPAPGETTTVHLVSVEGRYNEATGEFNFDNASQTDKIRLISLTSWRFACISNEQTFSNMIQGLERDHRSFRLPSSTNSDAEDFLKDGFTPVRHALRNGGKTLSWYRGPFVTGAVEGNVDLPVHASDALLRYHSDVGMFDVSYASAWELGRLMALQSPTFSTTLYDWKRLRDQQDKCNQQPEQHQHPLETLTVSTEMPESLKIWLDQLSHLQGIPFKYLVSDERLLPKESIRFFQIDTNWIRCLLDGAYSIGRITTCDFECDQKTLLSVPFTQSTGILIRSDIVSGYPGLLIDAYGDVDGKKPLRELRRQNLSPNILACIFQGDLVRLDIHQKPEMLHFALELSDNDSKVTYNKTLRNQQTISGNLPATRVIPIATLKEKINLPPSPEFNSGNFALQMLEAAEKVSFYRE